MSVSLSVRKSTRTLTRQVWSKPLGSAVGDENYDVCSRGRTNAGYLIELYHDGLCVEQRVMWNLAYMINRLTARCEFRDHEEDIGSQGEEIDLATYRRDQVVGGIGCGLVRPVHQERSEASKQATPWHGTLVVGFP